MLKVTGWKPIQLQYDIMMPFRGQNGKLVLKDAENENSRGHCGNLSTQRWPEFRGPVTGIFSGSSSPPPYMADLFQKHYKSQVVSFSLEAHAQQRKQPKK